MAITDRNLLFKDEPKLAELSAKAKSATESKKKTVKRLCSMASHH
jgi:hypothetical protein